MKKTELKKTTVELPADLWRKAKLRALEDGTDLRTVIITALDKHLSTKRRRKS